MSDYQSFKESVRDPALSAAYFLSKISDERSSTNLLIREINAKLDRIAFLESRIDRLEEMLSARPMAPTAEAKPSSPALVAEVDEQILAFVAQSQKCTAQEVADKLGYKGKNAACARLNRLAASGLLSKKQAGRKVFYFPSQVSR